MQRGHHRILGPTIGTTRFKNRHGTWIDTSPKKKSKRPIDASRGDAQSTSFIMWENANQNYSEIPPCLTLTRMAAIKKKSKTKKQVWARTGRNRNPRARWWECKMVPTGWKTVWRLLKTLKTELPSHPATLPRGIHPEGSKARSGRDVRTAASMAALFPAAKKNMEATQCPSTGAKPRVAYTSKGILSSLQREGHSDTCYSRNERWGHRAK